MGWTNHRRKHTSSQVAHATRSAPKRRAEQIKVVQRVQTIRAVGTKVTLMIYAWVGDLSQATTLHWSCEVSVC